MREAAFDAGYWILIKLDFINHCREAYVVGINQINVKNIKKISINVKRFLQLAD